MNLYKKSSILMLIQILRSFYSPFITLILYNKKGVITTPSVPVMEASLLVLYYQDYQGTYDRFLFYLTYHGSFYP